VMLVDITPRGQTFHSYLYFQTLKTREPFQEERY
jgi:hypothetical protein